jgi:hypothetical protein
LFKLAHDEKFDEREGTRARIRGHELKRFTAIHFRNSCEEPEPGCSGGKGRLGSEGAFYLRDSRISAAIFLRP